MGDERWSRSAESRGLQWCMEKGEDRRKGKRREGEMKRRKNMCTGAYDVASDARERAVDIGYECKRDVEGECLYSIPLRG
jgi:hypothetical protein